ncbi:MAG: mannitol dehydrogenase family protein [Geminicoccaceae bacterium]
MAVRLSLQTLAELPTEVARPSYHREQISPGIVHIGVGNFHRAHQAVYLDDLFNTGRDLDWGIIGAGFRPPDAAMRETLKNQDCLTTVVEVEPGTTRARVTGAMVDFMPVGQDTAGMVSVLDDPRIRIVSLTVTEGGYCIDPATGSFDPDHPDIRADAASPHSPSHLFGVLVAALNKRRGAGTAPFTVMSCDNIPGNGGVARDAVVGLADLADPDLAKWIRHEVAFPDSMVDRITPVTTERERDLLRQRVGIDDGWPVFCEPFRQWVMEDRFSDGRPALEEVGVTFTHDVSAYELMKIRMLNGGHAAIAYPAALLGIKTVHNAMADPLIDAYLDRLEREEIIPVVPAIPGVDLAAYLELIKRRFANPEVEDTIVRLCQDGSNRQPKFILPSIRDRLAQGQSVDGLALETALWCRYCYGETDAGETISIQDALADRLREAARRARTTPRAFLALKDIFGDIADNDDFSARFDLMLTRLWQDGVASGIGAYVDAA